MGSAGGRNDADKIFKYRDVDGEEEPREETTALYVDDLFRRQSGASPGRSPSSPLMKEDHPKLARWADLEADEDTPDMSEEMTATQECRRRAALSADSWSEGRDSLWRKSFDSAEWLPSCDVGCVTHRVG